MTTSATSDSELRKLCCACFEEFPSGSFSKKQWSQKQRRRCLGCADAGKEIDVARLQNSNKTAVASAPPKCTKKKKGRNKAPTYAGNKDAIFKPGQSGDSDAIGVGVKLAYDICSWCGKVEEGKELQTCGNCKNGRTPVRSERLNAEQKQTGAFTLTEASGLGSVCIDYSPGARGMSQIIFNGELRNGEKPGQYFASPQAEESIKRFLDLKYVDFALEMARKSEESIRNGELLRVELFRSLDELSAPYQFLLSCGPIPDITRAKRVLPFVLHEINKVGLMPDGAIPNIADCTVRGFGLNALEWAARRGNLAIAEWLATDSRTRVMLARTDSAPVAWACYTGRVELAQMLIKKGADSHATTEKVFNNKPPTHLAGENGQLLAVRFLVEECGHDISAVDLEGHDMRTSLRLYNKVWAKSAGCVAVDEYARSLGVLGEMSSTNKKSKAEARDLFQSKKDDKLAAALRQLEIAGGREDEPDDSEDEDEIDPNDYLNELLAVADARFELEQFSQASGLYYRAYYAAMHAGSVMNNAAIFPIAHKLIWSYAKSGQLKRAHLMAQQNIAMQGPPYIRDDLNQLETLMKERGMEVERAGMGGFGRFGAFR
ncbi:hypothetical protein THAOC_25176 [Thalassiosira oceanica]|uniref:Uncharacterized protein n=1 Tax=Thalassiosira oceanica TaxID=159749 RepID=K0RN01_THAOC|nr:hypothetical protein THAOC_25176 [Thalassiosira oceanica]|eukprot:EJK55123.1 hypothetical protein THAOC_25176 [Thalassiosira oceanica]